MIFYLTLIQKSIVDTYIQEYYNIEMKLPVKYDSLNPEKKKLVREQYIALQKGKCYYCGGELLLKPPKKILRKSINRNLFPKGFFKAPVHLHHSHTTGLTIGAVHGYCNAVLWQYEGE